MVVLVSVVVVGLLKVLLVSTEERRQYPKGPTDDTITCNKREREPEYREINEE